MFNFAKKTKKEPDNLKEVLKYLKKIEQNLENRSREIEELQKKNQKNFQKLGVIRFNPFQEVGGEQSFSIALLNAADNGFVITSLYTHEGNRVYAKPINHGQSEYQLSESEKQAIDKAINSGNPKSEIRNPKQIQNYKF